MKPISIGAATAAVLAAGLILDELLVPGCAGFCASWDWRFRALVAGAVTWFVAARMKRLRRRS